jgi:hypothetical protein
VDVRDRLGPPQFQEKDYGRLGWYQSIFRFLQRRTKSLVKVAAYSVEADVAWVWANATSGAFAVTLPSAAEWPDREIGVAKNDGSANAVTVSRAGTDTINGATSVSLESRYYNVLVKSDGISSWYVISRFPAVAG